MSETETVWMRGEGGSVIAMDLPLPHMIQQRVDSGEIKRANEDGSDYVERPAELADAEPESDGLAKPKLSAPKAEWVDYAEAHGMSRDDAEVATKADLIKRFDGK